MNTDINSIFSPDIELIRDLCALFGPSGFEREVTDFIEKKIKDLCDGYVIDKMGNLIALVRLGNKDSDERQKLMISAHTDEVGVMISEICEDGLLRFDTVGGINVSVLEGRKMTLGDERGKVAGLVMSKAIHHVKRSDRNKANKIEKLYIDIGAKSREEAEKVVSVGSFGTFDSEFYLFGEHSEYMKGKAIDDRLGCAALMSVMEKINADRPDVDLDVYFCFTTREEIGLSGAKVAANKISPDLAIVIETTAVGDIAGASPAKRVADLGKGGAVSIADRSTIYDKDFVDFAMSVAKEDGIPAQIKRYVSGGNDAGSIHKTGVGVRTLALSAPTRYLHSPSCVANVDDYRSICRLIEAMIRHIDGTRP